MRIRGYPEGTPCWAELCTPDVAGAARFYREMFGWQRDGAVFHLGGLAVARIRSAADADWLTCLATEDLGALARRVTAGGGTVVAAPSACGEHGRSATFLDPDGVPFAGWQRGTLAGAQLGSQPDTVCWSDLTTPDEFAAAAFYGKVFGWTAQPSALTPGRDYHDLVLHGRVVAGLVPITVRRPAARPHWGTTIEVRCRADAVQRCLDLGGRVALGSVNIPAGGYASLCDPAGARFGVLELAPPFREWAG